jgi:hypothetical protein
VVPDAPSGSLFSKYKAPLPSRTGHFATELKFADIGGFGVGGQSAFGERVIEKLRTPSGVVTRCRNVAVEIRWSGLASWR